MDSRLWIRLFIRKAEIVDTNTPSEVRVCRLGHMQNNSDRYYQDDSKAIQTASAASSVRSKRASRRKPNLGSNQQSLPDNRQLHLAVETARLQAGRKGITADGSINPDPSSSSRTCKARTTDCHHSRRNHHTRRTNDSSNHATGVQRNWTHTTYSIKEKQMLNIPTENISDEEFDIYLAAELDRICEKDE